MQKILELKNVSKFYYKNGFISVGIEDINLGFDIGEFVVITGESGSGKSTLLNVLSFVDSYSEGEILVDGMETSHYAERDREDYRRHYVGNIFQTFNLINSYTVFQNIELVLLLNGHKKCDIKDKVNALIKSVDLEKYRNVKASKLSGGQKQRVAIARALAKETPIIIADEPTGNLDSKSAKSIMKLLKELSKDKLVILVTHNYDDAKDYATRKIKMHDGHVVEDKKLNDYETNEQINCVQYHPMSFVNQLRVGILNAFNILPKFLLLLTVFLFISLALTFEYASYAKSEHELSLSGYNQVFANTDTKRVIVNKKDRTPITLSELDGIKKLGNVDYIINNDIVTDVYFYLSDNDNFYQNGTFKNIASFNGKLDYGRMPSSSNEIIIQGSKNDYYLANDVESLINKKVLLNTTNGEQKSVVIVGISYFDSYDDSYFYGFDDYFVELAQNSYAETKILLNNLYHTTDEYGFKIKPSTKVQKGYAYVNSNLNGYCNNFNCSNKALSIFVSNIYYKNNINLKISKMYDNKNIEKLLGIKEYESNDNYIYISEDDYNTLFSSSIYQSSIFVIDDREIPTLVKKLDSMNMNSFVIKDNLVSDEIQAIFYIIGFIGIIFVVLVLFFISYFIIKLILKSRNYYYSTIRILGASKQISKNLLVIDLFTVATIAYILVGSLYILITNNIIVNQSLKEILKYMPFSRYIMFYLIVLIITYVIASRYSRKVFKDTMINTYKEEV